MMEHNHNYLYHQHQEIDVDVDRSRLTPNQTNTPLNYGSYATPSTTTTTTATATNQFHQPPQPAGQDEEVGYMQEYHLMRNEDARTSSIALTADLVVDSSVIPRHMTHPYHHHHHQHYQNIYNGGGGGNNTSSGSGIEGPSHNTIENIIISSNSRQNSDRGSPASSDGQVKLLNYELYNPSSSSTSTPHASSISDFTPPPPPGPSLVPITYESTTADPIHIATTTSSNSSSNTVTVPEKPAIIKQHIWIQRTQITPTKALNCYVTESFNNGVITFYCGWPGCNHPIGFAHKAQVITHVRSAHLQEKPYVCTTCNTMFARKQDANRHVVSLNRGKQYRCSVCHRAYSRKHYRNEHEERCLLEALTGSPDTRV